MAENTIPPETGYYWLRLTRFGQWQIVYVIRGEDVLFAGLSERLTKHGFSTEYPDAKWGPMQMEERKDEAYLERNCCVALIARMALAMGCKAGLARTAIEGWSDDWHGCVYIDLPTGQVSWHFHDSQADLFAGLPQYAGKWDGHSTSQKYQRVGNAFALAAATPIGRHDFQEQVKPSGPLWGDYSRDQQKHDAGKAGGE